MGGKKLAGPASDVCGEFNGSSLAPARPPRAPAKMSMQAPTMAALEQIHLSSTCRLNGAARVGIIGQEARRLDQLANMSSDNELPRLWCAA
jgi:hypothetical protein